MMNRLTLIVLLLFCAIENAAAQVADAAAYLAEVKAELVKQWPKNRTINLVFHGHSVPGGYFRTPDVRTLEAYPHQVLEALKKQYPHAVINCITTAIGGENSEQGEKRFEQDVLTHRPDVLLIDYALNDRAIGLERSKAAMVKMIEKALREKIKVILVTPSPDLAVNLLEAGNVLEQHSNQLKALAEKYKLGLADSYGSFKAAAEKGRELKDLMSQNNHPNKEGHAVIAKGVLAYFWKASAIQPKQDILAMADQALRQSVAQYKLLMRQLKPEQLPRTFENGRLLTVNPYAWISGFYPGSVLYLYEYSKDTSLLREAKERLQQHEKLKSVTANHDLGFMMYCSFGNAYRQFEDPRQKAVLVHSAKSLATRFYPKVGCIKSWDGVKSLDGKRMLEFPVIIDNMMNLELLFFASRETGDPYFKDIAVRHTETTLKNHFRPDYSSYHVVNYDGETGEVKSQETHQGFSDNSTWSRGQAWAIYGFTMVYRETGDHKYLEAAQKMANLFLDHPNLPADKVPYWDFNVGQRGYDPVWKYDPKKYPSVPRDASAAAVVASALIELAGYVEGKPREKYQAAAETMLRSLSSPQYRAAPGENGGFILKHASGGVPGNIEVDVPLSYADYYYLEALMRYRALGK